MTEEEKLETRKRFRKFLRTREGITGADLDSVIRAAEQYVPTLVQSRFYRAFDGLYEERLDLSQLLLLIQKIEQDEQVLSQRQGYACLRAIKGYAKYFADKKGLNLEDFLPHEDNTQYPFPEENLSYHEGREYEVRGIRYERDREARSRCIDFYGCRCQVCGMSFEEVYGEIGKGYIEVHHIVPISERGGDYMVDPIRDLIPLCSNCHSIIHRLDNPSDIGSLKQLFSSQE